jgi:hypothetical protein
MSVVKDASVNARRQLPGRAYGGVIGGTGGDTPHLNPAFG